MHIFPGGNWGRESKRAVISQFAQKAEECISLLDISSLLCLTSLSGSWQLNTPSRKHKFKLSACECRSVIVTH